MPTPIDEIPLFVKAGSILPIGSLIQYAIEPRNPITLRNYPDTEGHFTLYEDEGDTYNYEKGHYATVSCQWNEDNQTLTLNTIQGDLPERLNQQKFRLVQVGEGHDVGVRYANP